MAVVFTVENGTGVTGANSYVAVATADDYFAVDTGFGTAWAAYTTQQKQYALIWATRILDQKVVWRGTRVESDQALAWPRTGTYDRDGVAIENDVVPPQVQQATMEMAKFLASSDPTTGQNVEFLKEIKVDVIELIWQDNAGQPQIPALFNEILDPLGVINVGGPRFARILKA